MISNLNSVGNVEDVGAWLEWKVLEIGSDGQARPSSRAAEKLQKAKNWDDCIVRFSETETNRCGGRPTQKFKGILICKKVNVFQIHKLKVQFKDIF